MVVVANSTPLIALSKIGLFELLKDYFSEILIPKEVYEEVVIRGGKLYGAKEVSNSEWIKTIEVNNRIAVDALLIIDDRDGRGMASSLGIMVTGTVGLLKYAAENGRIDLRNSMEELMASGFRLSKSEYDKIIRED